MKMKALFFFPITYSCKKLEYNGEKRGENGLFESIYQNTGKTKSATYANLPELRTKELKSATIAVHQLSTNPLNRKKVAEYITFKLPNLEGMVNTQ